MSGKILSPEKGPSNYVVPTVEDVADMGDVPMGSLEFDDEDGGLEGLPPLPPEEVKAKATQTHGLVFTNSKQSKPTNQTRLNHPVESLLQVLLKKKEQLSAAAKKLESTELTLTGELRDANEKKEEAQSDLDKLKEQQKKKANENYRKANAQHSRKVSHIWVDE